MVNVLHGGLEKQGRNLFQKGWEGKGNEKGGGIE
jgi:hypothetical protein